MKNPTTCWALLLLFGLMCPVGAVDDAPPQEVAAEHLKSDEEIRRIVLKGLAANPDVLTGNLRVTVTDGAVSLEGIVRSEEAKQAAEKVALTAPGAVSVKNLLTLRPTAVR